MFSLRRPTPFPVKRWLVHADQRVFAVSTSKRRGGVLSSRRGSSWSAPVDGPSPRGGLGSKVGRGRHAVSWRRDPGSGLRRRGVRFFSARGKATLDPAPFRGRDGPCARRYSRNEEGTTTAITAIAAETKKRPPKEPTRRKREGVTDPVPARDWPR